MNQYPGNTREMHPDYPGCLGAPASCRRETCPACRQDAGAPRRPPRIQFAPARRFDSVVPGEDLMKRWAPILAAGMTLAFAAGSRAADVGLIEIRGAIGPATASYISRAIDVAARQNHSCL